MKPAITIIGLLAVLACLTVLARESPRPAAASSNITAPASAGSYADIRGDEISAFVDAVAGVSRKAREDGMLDHGRICGTKYDKMTADYVKQKFTEFGLDRVWQETFPNGGPQWIPSEIKLTLVGGSSPTAPRKGYEFKTAMAAYSVRYTPAGGIEALIVDVGKGEAADLEGVDLTGKIVLVHAYVQGQTYRHSAQQVVPKLVCDGKALGVVLAIHQPGDPDVRYAITGGRGASEISCGHTPGGDRPSLGC